MKLKTSGTSVKKSAPVKKSNTKVGVDSKQIEKVEADIKGVKAEIDQLNAKLGFLNQKRLELLIAPYKLGDRVIAEVQVGKTKKKTECILEAGEGDFLGTLYLRPIKNDGKPSGRRFSLCPVDNNYQEWLEPVK